MAHLRQWQRYSFEQMEHVYELRQRGWSRLKVSRVTGISITAITHLCQRYRRLLSEEVSL